MTKYAILIIETGEYLYRYTGSYTYRSKEECFLLTLLKYINSILN